MPSFKASVQSTGPNSAKVKAIIFGKPFTRNLNFTPSIPVEWSVSHGTLHFSIPEEPQAVPFGGTIGKDSVNLHAAFHHVKLTGQLDKPMDKEYTISGGIGLPGRDEVGAEGAEGAEEAKEA